MCIRDRHGLHHGVDNVPLPGVQRATHNAEHPCQLTAQKTSTRRWIPKHQLYCGYGRVTGFNPFPSRLGLRGLLRTLSPERNTRLKAVWVARAPDEPHRTRALTAPLALSTVSTHWTRFLQPAPQLAPTSAPPAQGPPPEGAPPSLQTHETYLGTSPQAQNHCPQTQGRRVAPNPKGTRPEHP